MRVEPPAPITLFPALDPANADLPQLSARQAQDYAYFTDAMPGFPDPARLAEHAEALNEMSPAGILHYLDFFLLALEADPWGHDMVFHHLEGWLDRFASEPGDPTREFRLRLNAVATRRFDDIPKPPPQ